MMIQPADDPQLKRFCARLADLSTAILTETGVFTHAMAYPAGSYNDPWMPLMYAIRAEGIDL
jgi:hypothetical protein